MYDVNENDILTKVTRYNLIRGGRLVYIDVHEALYGALADRFVAVPNLVNIIAKQQFQGIGQTEEAALKDCLAKIKSASIEDLFPERRPQA